ncbi:hypothetical protein GGX14DRAFT_452703 [Mycena pura]|uniref:BHLH domain-containing protein n=1 Tax=Mycena pura TaxID=153505 RepID=A0AAD6VHD6_9AGAR|nr:hypothetical protein GGX14DRAFT_452703 [Mycena pura]
MTGKSGVHAASCSPPRSAKQAARRRSPSVSSSASEYTPEPRRIVPLSPKLSKTAAVEPAPPQPGTKRGRKPAAMSRTARETQRKLNHSIIEKARRTKINDALSTLKQLVPPNYGQQPAVAPLDEDGDAQDGEYDCGTKPQKKSGKREDKEKEFKLEILIRTVAFMQDLIQRVAVLEAGAPASCANCGGVGKNALKRKRSGEEVPTDNEAIPPALKRHEAKPASAPTAPIPSPSVTTAATASPALAMGYTGAPLPPISAWLSEMEPILSVPSRTTPAGRATPDADCTSYLPSPPASTHVAPVRPPAQLLPVLSLGPGAAPASGPSSSLHALLAARTPEDERAASLLLEISASSPTTGFCDVLGSASKASTSASAAQRQVQTPALLLGLAGKR